MEWNRFSDLVVEERRRKRERKLTCGGRYRGSTYCGAQVWRDGEILVTSCNR